MQVKKILIPIKRLFLIGDLVYSLRIFTLVKDYSMKNYLLSLAVFFVASLLAGC